MAIEYIPFEELFAHEYQSTYISPHGYIVVGPYIYNVFRDYSVAERQKALQDCAKWLNWLVSEIQQEWELCMYMYQWIIKSPPPFPYLEYTLSEEITMAISWDVQIKNVNLLSKRGDVVAVRTDSESALSPHSYSMQNTPMETTIQRLLILNTLKEWEETATANELAIKVFIDTLEQTAKTNLETWELTR